MRRLLHARPPVCRAPQDAPLRRLRAQLHHLPRGRPLLLGAVSAACPPTPSYRPRHATLSRARRATG